MGIHIGTCHGEHHKICSFTWPDNFWIMSHSQAHQEQKLKDLIEEAERWDLDPKPASLWWTSSHADEKMDDMTTRTRTRLHKLPFEKKFKTLGYTFNQTRRTQDSFEERMQSANKAWWRDVKMYRSEYVPWRITCRRSVEHVNSVFLLWERELVLEWSDHGQNSRMADKGYEAFVRIQKKGG